ncbi:tetratricopeptide repeat protein 37 [Pectinophora gossypiella]|uniref:tetratricopeptide repeat protein 37 n=1 Tax=Pectinophora gossypiella TaxID=13191 RepID=UPI00214EF9B1|nr:tetratricopeptide repeat protein 37 [Pectinophora gossypiella]
MADIKLLLKEARKLIDEKKYKEAQECCKDILRKDKQNYFGLILLGKSLQDSEQAPLAYQKAISEKPDHPLAWQGLANYYEGKDNNSLKPKLLKIYDEMLNLTLEDEKAVEIITKLGQLGCSLQNNEVISILLKYMGKELNPILMDAAEKQLVAILKANVLCKETDINQVCNILTKICTGEPNESLEVLKAQVILQKPNFVSAIEEVLNLKCFSNNVLLRELLCKYLCKIYVEKDSFSSFPIETYVEKITEGVENSKYPGLLKSIICYDKGLYLDAYKQCVPLINYQDADVTEATFIIKCTIKLKKWSVAQKLAKNFLTKVKDSTFTHELRKFLFLSLAKQQKWKDAIITAKQIPSESLSNGEQAILAECYIECNESADTLIESLHSTEHYIQLKALLMLKQEKYGECVALLETAPETALNLFYLGKAYWKLKQYDKCLINLLKAAKMDSDHAQTFLYLGHFYHHYKQDYEKSKKCYEKAYSLNSMDSSIAKNLSEIYAKLSLKDADFELLDTAQKDINEPWVCFRLGLHYLNRRDWEKAIINFRNVIKNDQNNITAFECLADAYYSRGSFTSALRAYNKVMILNPGQASHCLTRTGYIYSLLTQYEDAISTFEKVLDIDPNSLLALKGIAETWMRVAKKKESAKLYGSARDYAQYAVNYITKALSKQKQLSCFWKLMADTLMFITKLPNKYSFVYIKDTFNDSNNELIKINKLEIFPQAIACYSYIAKLKQQVASYDLALAYLEYYHESKKLVNCNISFNLTISCIQEKPLAWRNWNLLGKICLFVQKHHIAQHCFIKALLVTRKWSVAKIWCNLGTLYLKLKLYKLANYCFWRGQSTLPSYPQSWIGQGLIAEEIREEEAMDLFRHASRLGYHPESALGYADWVCRTLKNQRYKEDPESRYVIEGLHAIPYAMDLMEWFLNFDPNNACACIIMGILQERSGLLHGALRSYEKALQYAEEDKKNIALLNIGRIMLRLGHYEEAIKAYKAITEASLNSASGLALALFKKDLYEESYSAYDTALHWLSNDDDEKADLLVAMAGIVYMFKGVDDAKTILFHSIQVSQKKPTAFSLFAICSLGLIHSDQSLSKLALGELQKYEKDSNFGFDTGFLKSYLLVTQNNVEEAIKLLSDSLHDHPNNALLWYCMAQYCLRAADTRAKIASCCAQRALCLAHYSEFECDPAKMIATASISEHLAGNRAKALLLAKQGLHMYPRQAEIWAALLFSLISHKKWIEKTDWIASVAGYMRRQLDVTRPLSRWVGLLEKKMHVK